MSFTTTPCIACARAGRLPFARIARVILSRVGVESWLDDPDTNRPRGLVEGNIDLGHARSSKPLYSLAIANVTCGAGLWPVTAIYTTLWTQLTELKVKSVRTALLAGAFCYAVEIYKVLQLD